MSLAFENTQGKYFLSCCDAVWGILTVYACTLLHTLIHLSLEENIYTEKNWVFGDATELEKARMLLTST